MDNIDRTDNSISGSPSSPDISNTKSGATPAKIRKRIRRKVPVGQAISPKTSSPQDSEPVEGIVIEEHEPRDSGNSQTPLPKSSGISNRQADQYRPATPFFVPPPPSWNKGGRPSRVQHLQVPARRLDKSAVYGIVITSVLFVILFVAIFAPWLTVYHEYDRDWDYYSRDYESKYKWNSYDIKGEGYGRNSHDRDFKGVFRADSMGNGRTQAFVGIGLGILFGVGLIVVGAIRPVSIPGRRLIIFFRGGGGVLMLLAATFIMIAGSKFIGYSLCYSFSGNADDKERMLCIVPYILLIVGILLFWLYFNLINNSFRRFRAMKRTKDPRLDAITIVYSKRLRRIATCLVILGMLALVTLPLLPIVYRDEKGDYDEEDSRYYISSGILFDEEIQRWSDWDFIDYLDWLNIMFWIIFSLTILSLLAALFLFSSLNDLTGYILGLVSTLICLPLITSIVFKILFIVDVYDHKYKYNEFYDYYNYHDYGSMKFGYNYLPMLVIIGLVVLTVLYMVYIIKGSARYIRSMPRHYGTMLPEYGGYWRGYEHHGRNGPVPGHRHERNRRNRIPYHYPPPPPG